MTTTDNQKTSLTADSRAIADRLVAIAEEHKAKNIKLYDLEGSSLLADYFLVCSASSEPHIMALATHFNKDMRDMKVHPARIEGAPSSRWIIIDYGAVVVHVFHPEVRNHYKIEDLWDRARPVYEGGHEETRKIPVF